MWKLLSVLILLLYTSWAQAGSWGTACSYSEFTNTFPVANNRVSIDPNAPVGTIFYKVTSTIRGVSNFNCSNSPVTATVAINYDFLSSTTARGYTTLTSYGATPIWKTNIAGVGVMLVPGDGSNLSKRFPQVSSAPTSYNNTTFIVNSYPLTVSALLVKYGPINPGTQTVTLDSSTIPATGSVVTVTNSTDITLIPNTPASPPLWISKLNFSNTSNITLVNATCDAPMVPVDMGKHHISEFTTESSRLVGPWVDASITLTNCPVFYGSGSASLDNAVQSNTMKVTITPGNATTSNIGLMPVNAGLQAATNVGIQLGWGTEMNKTLLNFASGKASNTYVLTSSQDTIFKIPLVARYRQINAGTIGGGNANGQMTYVIDYY